MYRGDYLDLTVSLLDKTTAAGLEASPATLWLDDTLWLDAAPQRHRVVTYCDD